MSETARDPDLTFGSGRRLVTAALVIATVPLAVTLVRVLVERGFALHGDAALIELRVRDVGSHTPLVGSYQRFGWNQPGPLLLYFFAIPYRVLGSTFAGLEVGALLLSAGSIVGITAVAFRRGGAVLMLWSLTLVALVVHGLGGGIAEPWEPKVIVLLSILLLFLTFDTVSGSAWSLPIAAAVTSMLAQAYAGVGPVAVTLFAFAVAGLVWRTWWGPFAERGVRRGQARAVLAVTGGVIAVLWLPPFIEQLTGDPGNLTEMWRFFEAPHDTLGLGDAAAAVSLQLGHRAPWLGWDVPLLPGAIVDLDAAPIVPFGAVALAAALAVSGRRRDRSFVLALAVLVTVAASVLSLSRLVGGMFSWILGWTTVVGVGCWLAAGWCAFRALPDTMRRRVERPIVVALSAALVAVTAVSTVDAATRSYEREWIVSAFTELGDRAVDELGDVDGPVLVEVDYFELGVGGLGPELLVLNLERHGIDTVVDPELENRFGSHRTGTDEAVAEVRVVVGGKDAVPAGYRYVSTFDPLTPADRAQRAELEAELHALVGENASLQQIADVAERDAQVRTVIERLGDIDDLPQLTLVVRER